MIRVLVAFIFFILVNPLPASAQPGGFGRGIKPDPKLAGKKIVNKLALYNASKYDNKKTGQLITHEKLKREIIEVIRFDILSSYIKECPVQSPAVSQDYAALISIILKNDEGSSKWDDGVLEYQYAVSVPISDSAKILCVISNDNNLIETIKKNQKRADDALATIFKFQNDSYDKNMQETYDRAVNIFEATNYLKEGIVSDALGDLEDALDAYDEAVELSPKAVEIYFRKGLLNRKLENYEESVKDFNRVIEMEKNFSDAYFERGTTYAYLGNREKVLDDFKTAARLGSNKARDFLKSKNISWE